jgi:hypothetical protein
LRRERRGIIVFIEQLLNRQNAIKTEGNGECKIVSGNDLRMKGILKAA